MSINFESNYLLPSISDQLCAYQKDRVFLMIRDFIETNDNVNIKFTKNDRLKITNFDHIYSSRESRTSFVL